MSQSPVQILVTRSTTASSKFANTLRYELKKQGRIDATVIETFEGTHPTTILILVCNTFLSGSTHTTVEQCLKDIPEDNYKNIILIILHVTREDKLPRLSSCSEIKGIEKFRNIGKVVDIGFDESNIYPCDTNTKAIRHILQFCREFRHSNHKVNQAQSLIVSTSNRDRMQPHDVMDSASFNETKNLKDSMVPAAPNETNNLEDSIVPAAPKVTKNNKDSMISAAPKTIKNIKDSIVLASHKETNNIKDSMVIAAPKEEKHLKDSMVSSAPKKARNLNDSLVPASPKETKNLKDSMVPAAPMETNGDPMDNAFDQGQTSEFKVKQFETEQRCTIGLESKYGDSYKKVYLITPSNSNAQSTFVEIFQNKMKDLGIEIDVKEPREAKNLDHDLLLIIVCIATSRIESDINSCCDEDLRAVSQRTILIVLHVVREGKEPKIPTEAKIKSDSIFTNSPKSKIIDIAFDTNSGMYDCTMNNIAEGFLFNLHENMTPLTS
ncbi:uncharacterized protein LOC132734360 isoform X2 [Ruditapes philippinarum]|nr:uncharacterized protein LOC132734360 isoform X2 [Ruditapes philippinarum]